MNANKRNFLVGITVLTGAGIFIWMLMTFGAKGASLLAPPQIKITIVAEKADGLSEGSPVTYIGVPVGRVTKLERNPDGEHVTITALIDTQPPVPQNVTANVVTTNLISGGATVMLELRPGEKPRFNAEGITYQPLVGRWVGLRILPEEYGDTAKAVTEGVHQLSLTIQEVRDKNLVQQWHDTVENINVQITKAGDVLDVIQKLAGDPAVQGDIRQTIANLRQSSDHLKDFMSTDLPRLSAKTSSMVDNANATLADARQRFDDLSRQVGDSLAKLSRALDDIQSITSKLDKGQGSAGLLVNDPKLYQSFVDSARQLNVDLKDLDRIILQWEQEGVAIKGFGVIGK